MSRFTPPWIDQINFIAEYYISGCEAPWSLYFQCAKKPFFKLALLMVTADWEDTLKEIFRPRGLRSGRHARHGRKSGRHWKGIPDPSEYIAQKVNVRELIWERRYFWKTHVFYIITDTLDFIGWNVFLVETFTEIFYEACLGVLEHNGAACPTVGRTHRQGDYQVNGGAGAYWQPYPQGQLMYEYKCHWGANSLIALEPGNWVVTWGLTLRVVTFPAECQIRVIDPINHGEPLGISEMIYLQPGDVQDLILNFSTPGGRSMAFEIHCQGNFVDSLKNDVTILQVAF